jgi:hypothetical protein
MSSNRTTYHGYKEVKMSILDIHSVERSSQVQQVIHHDALSPQSAIEYVFRMKREQHKPSNSAIIGEDISPVILDSSFHEASWQYLKLESFNIKKLLKMPDSIVLAVDDPNLRRTVVH